MPALRKVSSMSFASPVLCVDELSAKSALIVKIETGTAPGVKAYLSSCCSMPPTVRVVLYFFFLSR